MDETVSGPLLAEITNQMVRMTRKHYGRGPLKAKTYMLDNLVTVVMTDGFTAAEQTAMDADEPNRVLGMRRDFQEHIAERYKQIIEQVTNRKVTAFLSQTHLAPDITVEMFLLDGAAPGAGALELIEVNEP